MVKFQIPKPATCESCNDGVCFSLEYSFHLNFHDAWIMHRFKVFFPPPAIISLAQLKRGRGGGAKLFRIFAEFAEAISRGLKSCGRFVTALTLIDVRLLPITHYRPVTRWSTLTAIKFWFRRPEGWRAPTVCEIAALPGRESGECSFVGFGKLISSVRKMVKIRENSSKVYSWFGFLFCFSFTKFRLWLQGIITRWDIKN